MKKFMDVRRIGALIALPFFLGAASLAASADDALTKSAAGAATPGTAEATDVATPPKEAMPEAVLAPKPDISAGSAPQSAPEPVATKSEPADGILPAVVAQDLIGKPVTAADGKAVGKVSAVKAGKAGELLAVHIETGGYFGFWTTLREVPAGEFTPTSNGIQLRLASNEIENLSKIEVPKG